MMFTGHDNTIRNDLNSKQVEIYFQRLLERGHLPVSFHELECKIIYYNKFLPLCCQPLNDDYHDALVTRRLLITNQQWLTCRHADWYFFSF